MTTTIELQNKHQRLLFEVSTLERDILSIRHQLEDATEPATLDEDAWYKRATGALKHKERQHRIHVAKAERLERQLGKITPDARKEEAKGQLKEVMAALFLVAKTALEFYDTSADDDETAFTDAVDRLDDLVPGWNK